MRRAVQFAVLVAIGLVLSRVWFVEPSIVTTGSMFPALAGHHVDLKCADCGLSYACDAQDGGLPVACPNCGYQVDGTEGRPAIDGDRLLINRAAFALRDPRRWEVVAFRCPDRPSRICIKRVVGLPGETVEIRHGDVFVDGKIVRKTLSQQMALAVPVYDGSFPPHGSETALTRWHGEQGRTRWQAGRRDGVVRFVLPATTSTDNETPKPLDWLTYHHRGRGGDSSDVGSVAATITDVQAYNRDTARHAFSTVDVMWSCQLRAGGPGYLLLRAVDSVDEFLVRIDMRNGSAELLQNGQTVEKVRQDTSALTSGTKLTISLVDRQFLFAVAGRPRFRPVPLPVAPGDKDDSPTWQTRAVSRPFAVAAQGPEVEIWDLQIHRDAYYTPVPTDLANQPKRRNVKLAVDEFFVLGDNSALAADSRTWPGTGGIAAKHLVGKPLVVHRPSRLLVLAGLRFQVPDLEKIRYIR